METYQEVVKEHYRSEANNQGLHYTSTMPDEIVRSKEIEAIRAYLRLYSAINPAAEVLEIGCGNGYLLDILHREFPKMSFSGMDYTHEMVELARSRQMKNVHLEQGNVCSLSYKSQRFDLIISERVIINLLDRNHQDRAFEETARILKPGGWFICIEGFATPLANLNAARAELGLAEIKQPFHNRWYTDQDWKQYLENRFEIIAPSSIAKTEPLAEPNFLSTHYFVTRVFHDLVKPEGGVVRNSLFGKFFSSVLPNHGDYAPVKLYLLRKISSV